ncbi:hypothetical protein INR49_000208, partial [Caranx melampygus]
MTMYIQLSSQARPPASSAQLHCTGQLPYRSTDASETLRYVTSDWLHSQGPSWAGEPGRLSCSSCSTGMEGEMFSGPFTAALSSRLWGWSAGGHLPKWPLWPQMLITTNCLLLSYPTTDVRKVPICNPQLMVEVSGSFFDILEGPQQLPGGTPTCSLQPLQHADLYWLGAILTAGGQERMVDTPVSLFNQTDTTQATSQLFAPRRSGPNNISKRRMSSPSPRHPRLSPPLSMIRQNRSTTNGGTSYRN